MAYICHKKMNGYEKVTTKNDDSLWRSKGIDGILAELRAGYMIQFEITKIEKEEVKLAWPNLDFFNTYPSLIRIILDEVKPEY